MDPNTGRKTVIDLARQLGIRTEILFHTLERMGIPQESAYEIDPALEQGLIEQMAADGIVSAALGQGKKIRKATEAPVVDDDLLLEALGASEAGFSDAHIPSDILLEAAPSSKPSFFHRWFGRPRNLAAALKENPRSPEEIEALFSPLEPALEHESAFPPREPSGPFPPASGSESEAVPADEPALPEADEAALSGEDLDEPEAAGWETETLDDRSPFLEQESPIVPPGEPDQAVPETGGDIPPLDARLMSEIEKMEIEGGGDLEEIEISELEQLEGLGELDELPKPVLPVEGMGSTEDASGETAEDLAGLPLAEDLDDLDEEEGIEEIESLGNLDEEENLDPAEIEKELEETRRLERRKEEETPAGWVEWFFSRIQLTPLEMWTLIGGSAVTLAAMLGVSLYWWWNLSPQARTGVLEEADHYYQTAAAAGENPAEWSKARKAWQSAADTYETFINQYAEDPQRREEAFSRLCDSYYQMALGDEKAGDTPNSEDAYRRMIQYYEKYMVFLEKTADRMADAGSGQPHLAFPDASRQQTALYRIAMAQKKLHRFDTAIESLKNFINRFGSAEHGLDAMMQIGNVYQDWAQINQEQELPLLNEAAAAYSDALNKTPEDSPAARMRLHARLGDIEFRKYQRSLNEQKPEEANSHLVDAVAQYEKAAEDAGKFGLETLAARPDGQDLLRDIQKTKKTLGDLYLLRGREAGEKWREYEDLAKPFPESIMYKQKLMDAADLKKTATVQFLDKAHDQYLDLLAGSEHLDPKDYDDIRYNITESLFILRDYPQAIAAGEEILNGTRQPSPEAQTRLNYLLGHAAWEEAKETGDYSKVKKFYYRALELDDFYPADQKGETSHLAEIRLINAYYMLEKKYEEALRRFQNAVERYPETGYTYLTLYWYANATQEYADSLMDEADRLETETQPAGPPGTRPLREKARSLYADSIDRYNRAIASRDTSKYVDTKNETFLIDILFDRGHAAFKAGQYTDAEKYFQEALRRYQDNPVAQKFIPAALERMGDLNYRLGNFTQAAHHYQQYLNNPYEDANARVSLKLADAYLKQYSYDKARAVYQKIARDYPSPSPQETERAMRQGRPIEKGPGFEALKKIAESFFQEAAPFVLEEREARLRDALQAYQELVARYPLNPASPNLPDDADSLYKIASIQSELNNLPEAVKGYEAFLQQVPNYPRQGMLYYKIAQACLDMNPPDCDKAIDSLKHVDEKSFDSPGQYASALILHGQAWEKKANESLAAGDPDLYMTYLEQAGRIYSRVAAVPAPDKIKEALVMRQAIDSILESRKELAKAKTP
ncbi:MAG: tetratricopeptide repeat protein [bacterium]